MLRATRAARRGAPHATRRHGTASPSHSGIAATARRASSQWASSSSTPSANTAALAPLRRPRGALKLQIRWSSTASPQGGDTGEVTLGGVTSVVRKPDCPELVPTSGYLPDDAVTLEQIRWMMQKHNLGQDIYLMGTPGPRRRWLALKFCYALMKEVEYLSLSRDTTESDVKQRREIRDGGLVFVDQAAVRAAIHGRVLILDGVERVERNVLPIINNLLENREMSLEDGRFLTSPARYDELLQTHTPEELDAMGLVRVSPEFRVIALGLPVPRYAGTPLDPPLRSRFQCLGVDAPSLGHLLGTVRQLVGNPADAETIVGFMAGLQAAEASGTDQDRERHFPDMIEEDLINWGQAFGRFPADPLVKVLRRAYPFHILSDFADDQEQARRFFSSVLRRYSLDDPKFAEGDPTPDAHNAYSLPKISLGGDGDSAIPRHAEFEFPLSGSAGDPSTRRGGFLPSSWSGAAESDPTGSATVSATGGCGESPPSGWGLPEGLKLTPTYVSVLTDMLKDHCLGNHLCLIGEGGSGKSALVKAFASLLGYGEKASTIHCHWDMSARDMLQRRGTDDKGDTVWLHASLAEAAISGRLVILDGVDKLQPGVLASIGRLLLDSESTLYDGAVLRRSADFQRLLAGGATREELAAQNVFEVHPAFRVIALGHPHDPTREGQGGATGAARNWVEGEVQHFFSFHRFATPPVAELREILDHTARDPALLEAGNHIGSLRDTSRDVAQLLTLHGLLQQEHAADSATPVMSLRQMRRIARSCAVGGRLYDAVSDSLLLDIMPAFVADRVGELIRKAEIMPSERRAESLSVSKDPEGKSISIGSATYDITRPQGEEAALVPSIVFHDNQEHLAVLQKLIFDMKGDSHILLIGRQGVGKNRLVDRLLQLLERPRQYVQLHRDSTVSSLTVRPEVVDGKIVWEDAPLVKAVKYGHILVVDEIDKAPLEAVGMLKGLVEDQELLLSDGRRVVRRARRDGDADTSGWSEGEGAIEIHPSFRLIALANVPGFPFLGNDFFASCGDLFRCHLVDNPQRESRLEVLRQYGPTVPAFAMNAMVDAFEGLAHYVDEGLLAYPYSLRELVAVVKHVEKYPEDGMSAALRNVFDFDAFDATTREIIEGVFEKHGIPLTGNAKPIQKSAIVQGTPLPAPEMVCKAAFDKRTGCGTAILPSSNAEGIDWAWSHAPPAETPIAEGRDEGIFDEKIYTIAAPGAVRALTSTDDGCLHAVVDMKGSPVLITWRGRDLYVPISTRPTHLDHAAHTVIDLAEIISSPRSLLFGSADSDDDGISLVSVGNSVAISSRGMDSILLVDPRERKGRLLTPPLSRRGESGAPSDPSSSSATPASDASGILSGFSKLAGLGGVPAPHGGCPIRTDAASGRFNRLVIHNGLEVNIFDAASSQWLALEVSEAGGIPASVTSATSVGKAQLLIHTASGGDSSDPRQTAYRLELASEENGALRIDSSRLVVTSGGVGDAAAKSDADTPAAPLQITEAPAKFVSGMPGVFLPESAKHTLGGISVQGGSGTNSSMADKPAAEGEEVEGGAPVGKTASISMRSLPAEVLAKTEDGAGLSLHPATAAASERYQVHRLGQFRIAVVDAEEADIRLLLVTDAAPFTSHSEQREVYRTPPPGVANGHSLCVLPNNTVAVTTPQKRQIAVFDLSHERVTQEWAKWSSIIGGRRRGLGRGGEGGDGEGEGEEEDMKFHYSNSGITPNELNHGKEDPDNTPHIGGTTWAGGTGGTDTAGLGGKVGPYRLDAGHPVHQVSDEVKQNVPQHLKDQARQMGRDALSNRLKEIKMTQQESSMYNRAHDAVRKEVAMIQTMLKGLKSKEGERVWLRNQPDGVWDEAKLVEGLTGEKGIFKKRGESKDSNSPLGTKKKRIIFCMDCSASMYRFNSMDHRLDRSVEAAIMVTESFKGVEEKIEYSMVGHSGDSPAISLVNFDKPPQNKKQRLEMVLSMVAHTQYCWSGDNTLESLRHAIKVAAEKDSDQRFVFLVSDANLRRYGISTKELARLVKSDPRVNVFCIFIASMGQEAERIKRDLPAGHGHVCYDSADLPSVLKRIFLATNLLR